MVSRSRIEGCNGTQNLSAGERKTIESIKEIVGNHSDADIYVTLKETNMDPNETTQKLLNQDPFHEVKRKRDKKKEVIPLKKSVPIKTGKPTEQLAQEMKSNSYSDRSPRRAGPVGYLRNNISDAGVSRQFRVVRDNRNQNENVDIKRPAKSSVSVSAKEPLTSNASEKSSAEASKNLKSLPNLLTESLSKLVKVSKTHETQQSSVTLPNSSVIGVYSSSSDPVHIPSLAFRPVANVGAIKRKVGPVGVRRHAYENFAKLSSVQQATSVSNSKEHFRSFPIISKSDQPSQSNAAESVSSISAGRSLNNHYSNRPHQHIVTHQKAPQAYKEWKPKSSQKLSVTEVGVIGTPKKPTSFSANRSKNLAPEAAQLQAKLPQAAIIHEDQNVIIAAHIRVSETDRCRLTFGSLGIEVESSQNSRYQETSRHVEESHVEPLASLPKQVELVDERAQSSGSISPAAEPQSTERLESSSPQSIENYTNTGLVRHSSSPSYTPSEPHHHQQGPSELPSFSLSYDPHTGYDMSYFRTATDKSLRDQMLQIPQEAFSSHVANSIPSTTIPMVQQQQAPMAQMYPQVHLPHYANLMPYRQFLSPVYVPPMVMPGYSNNPTYSPHPSTGSSYFLMPEANSPHVNANGLKYAIPQYKSLQAGSPTGFGNFTSPSGYTINTLGVEGSALGLDDSSRFKYKDGNVNVYVPNPQAETSELWMNPRDIQQSASYYNMASQTPQAAYMQSHTAHVSFNSSTQSSHIQFPGMYHSSRHAAIANPHHTAPTMSGNVGVAVGALGTQVGGGYQQQQQPQLNQLSWTGNF